MGSMFLYVADEALRPYNPAVYTHCQVCEKPGVRVFTAQGTAMLPDGSQDYVYVACAECLRAGRIKQADEWATDPVIDAYARRYLRDATPDTVQRLASELKNKLHRIPHDAPAPQRTDWPLCCGDLTEYMQSPQTRAEWELLTRTAFGWRRGEVLAPDPDDEDEPDDEWPEWHPWLKAYISVDGGDELPSLGAFATFRCRGCGRQFWTFQCT